MEFGSIAAIVLAAGKSQRMGRPKLLLPWGVTTVLGQVIATLFKAGIPDILVVTGGDHEQVESLVATLASDFPVRTTYNPDYTRGEMLGSIQAGLPALDARTQAALVALGDQPQIQERTVRDICEAHLGSNLALTIPSYQNKRGHPWLAARKLWGEILVLPPSATSRQFLEAHAGQVRYVAADASILQDLDTPEDYSRFRPGGPC